MASKADFSEQEWETMRKGVAGAGMLVSVGDRDFTDTFGEAGALAKRLGQERESGPSELIRELAAGRPAGFGLTASAQEVEAETRTAAAILAAKAPTRQRPTGSLCWMSPTRSRTQRVGSSRGRPLRSTKSSRPWAPP